MWPFSTWMPNLFILIVTLVFLIYKYSTRHFDYWKKRGVYYKEPIPLFGNFFEIVTFKTTTFELLKKIYDDIDQPYFGIFAFHKPILVIKCPNLIKDVLIKDFNVFCDRSIAAPSHNSTISNFLFMQKVPKWKTTRSKLTPFFTLSMMKSMFVTVDLVCKDLVRYLEQSDEILDAKHLGGQFATEAISRCFYGVDPHGFDKEVSSFRKYVDKIFEFSFRNVLIQSCHFYYQTWVDVLRLDFLNDGIVQYFYNVFKSAMEARNNPDGKMVNMIDLIKASKDDSELSIAMSSALFLMVAGQETTSSLIGYVLYELALHQDIQRILREEIENEIDQHGAITHEGVKNMEYLNMIISEGLRKYAVLPFLDRSAKCDYRLNGTNLVIEKGMTVYIPLYPTHMNPQYYPDPGKFDPERFRNTDFNEDGLKYFPFGDGPRICIGKRLGIMMAAMAICHVVSKFNIDRCKETPDPVKFEPKCLVLQSSCGLPVKLTPII